MRSETAILILLVFASGCTSTSNGTEPPVIAAENITASQNSNTTVEVEASNTGVLGIADPTNIIKEFDIKNAEVQERSSETSGESIGWTVSWKRPDNRTLNLPIDTSKDPGVYRYSLIAINSGKTYSQEFRVRITG